MSVLSNVKYEDKGSEAYFTPGIVISPELKASALAKFKSCHLKDMKNGRWRIYGGTPAERVEFVHCLLPNSESDDDEQYDSESDDSADIFIRPVRELVPEEKTVAPPPVAPTPKPQQKKPFKQQYQRPSIVVGNVPSPYSDVTDAPIRLKNAPNRRQKSQPRKQQQSERKPRPVEVQEPPPKPVPRPRRPIYSTIEPFEDSASISPEFRRILELMSEQVNHTISDVDLLNDPQYKDLRLQQLLDAQSLKPKSSEPITLLNVPSWLGSFFIESFAIALDTDKRHAQIKEFAEPIKVGIPKPVFIRFTQTEPGKIQFGFYDTQSVSGSDIHSITSVALNSIYSRSVLQVAVEGVDSKISFTCQDLDELAMKFGTPVIKTNDIIDNEDETRSFSLLILQCHWSEDKERRIRQFIEQLMERGRIHHCNNCHLIYVNNDGSGCTHTLHKGEQIDIRPGLREDVVVENGTETIFGNFKCCGIVPVSDPGCGDEFRFPNHVPRPGWVYPKERITFQTIASPVWMSIPFA